MPGAVRGTSVPSQARHLPRSIPRCPAVPVRCGPWNRWARAHGRRCCGTRRPTHSPSRHGAEATPGDSGDRVRARGPPDGRIGRGEPTGQTGAGVSCTAPHGPRVRPSGTTAAAAPSRPGDGGFAWEFVAGSGRGGGDGDEDGAAWSVHLEGTGPPADWFATG